MHDVSAMSWAFQIPPLESRNSLIINVATLQVVVVGTQNPTPMWEFALSVGKHNNEPLGEHAESGYDCAMALRRMLLAVGVLVVVVAAVWNTQTMREFRYRWTSKAIQSNPEAVSNAFAILYHAKGEQTFNNLRWFGTPVQKNPMDLWIYQEMISEIRPDVIVECGTYKGGSALYMAHLMDLAGKGRVITIDIEKYPGLPSHPRITYLLGSSTDPEIVRQVREAIRPGQTVMVFLDSDHSKAHVSKELELYHGLVTVGSYLVVEDTDLNGHPILPKHGPGPMEAAEEFLRGNERFEVDRSREKLLVTFNPRGYLKRVR
jgi:cephalosporin hydroxylase